MSLTLLSPLSCLLVHSRCQGFLQFHSITLKHTPPSVGLLWTSNLPVAETSTWQHKYCTRQTSMCPVRFEPTIPASVRPQTYALDRAATGIGRHISITSIIWWVLNTNENEMLPTGHYCAWISDVNHTVNSSHSKRVWNGSVGKVTRLRTARRRKRDSFPGRSRATSFPKPLH
jgi:hypothetical protein